MRLMYGAYQFPDGQVAVMPKMRTELDQSGRPIRYHWTIDVEGMLLLAPGTSDANAPLNMSQQEVAMRAALSLVAKDLILYDQFGRRTSIVFLNDANAVDYLQCTSLMFNDGGAGELVTKRSFRAQFSISYQANGRLGSWISYYESIEVLGNGLRRLNYQDAVIGSPVPVEIHPETTIRVVCSGQAVGWSGPPRIPTGPLPTTFLKNPDMKVGRQSPHRQGPALREYSLSWYYLYEGTVRELNPNNILPRVWPTGL